jgi:hypothetical protein
MVGVIYNVTVNISDNRVEEWLNWMASEHIPEMLGTGIFQRATLVRVLGYEQGGKTYAIQYRCRSLIDFERYENEFAPKLQAKTSERFGEELQAFRTVLEVVEEFGLNPAGEIFEKM